LCGRVQILTKNSPALRLLACVISNRDCATVDNRQSIAISTHYHQEQPFFLYNPTLETTMRTIAEPRIAEEGVTFTVEVGFTDRECLVSKNALSHLRRLKGGQAEADSMETYRTFEDVIHGVARRLVIAGVSGTPLVLGAAYFV
jgi:hypothetical protein